MVRTVESIRSLRAPPSLSNPGALEARISGFISFNGTHGDVEALNDGDLKALCKGGGSLDLNTFIQNREEKWAREQSGYETRDKEIRNRETRGVRRKRRGREGERKWRRDGWREGERD